MTKLQSFNVKRFQKDNFQDANLEQVQTASEKLWNDVRNHPLLKGSLIKDIVFNNNNSWENHVQHKLNRVPKGYIIVGSNVNAGVYDIGRDEKFLNLVTDGITATVSIWVF